MLLSSCSIIYIDFHSLIQNTESLYIEDVALWEIICRDKKLIRKGNVVWKSRDTESYNNIV